MWWDSTFTGWDNTFSLVRIIDEQFQGSSAGWHGMVCMIHAKPVPCKHAALAQYHLLASTWHGVCASACQTLAYDMQHANARSACHLQMMLKPLACSGWGGGLLSFYLFVIFFPNMEHKSSRLSIVYLSIIGILHAAWQCQSSMPPAHVLKSLACSREKKKKETIFISFHYIFSPYGMLIQTNLNSLLKYYCDTKFMDL